jgi:hypothetical protein
MRLPGVSSFKVMSAAQNLQKRASAGMLFRHNLHGTLMLRVRGAAHFEQNLESSSNAVPHWRHSAGFSTFSTGIGSSSVGIPDFEVAQFQQISLSKRFRF